MGIRGLSSYVKHRIEEYSIDYELHDTYVVIDGKCVNFHTYFSNKLDPYFGGEYEQHEELISTFFEELLACNVKPLILLDGGIEDKKMDCLLERTQQRLKAASQTIFNQEKFLMPILTKEIFVNVARRKNIRVVQTTFEADDDIASIARILDCPVISNDSDFYIYNVKYIPLDSLRNGLSQNSKGRLVKRCRLHTNASFVKNFPGLETKMLPLAAAILGNDFIGPAIFENFMKSLDSFNHLCSTRIRGEWHRNIEVLFFWIRNHKTLDSAIAEVLKKLPVDKRENVLQSIEMIINSYNILKPNMMVLLGFPKKRIEAYMQKIKLVDIYRYKGEVFDQPNEPGSNKTSNSLNLVFGEQDMTIIDALPSIFMSDYNSAMLASNFIDMLNKGCIFGTDQPENHLHTPCFNISLRIRSVIYRILTRRTTNETVLKYIGRIGSKIQLHELDCEKYPLKAEIPPLEQLVELESNTKLKIFKETMKSSDEWIQEFPPAWNLYI